LIRTVLLEVLGCQDSFKMAVAEVASFETNFFRRAGTSQVETPVSGKAKCLLVKGEDKKVWLFRMIFFFKRQRTIPKAMLAFLLCTADFCQLLKKKALATLVEAK